MSSAEGDGTPRLGPACDQCSVRKTKCRPDPSGEGCLSCAQSSFRCTRLRVHKRRGPKRSRTLAFETESAGGSSQAGGERSVEPDSASTGAGADKGPAYDDNSYVTFFESIAHLGADRPVNPPAAHRPWDSSISPSMLSSNFTTTSQSAQQSHDQQLQSASSPLRTMDWAMEQDPLDSQSIFSNLGIFGSQADVRNTLPFFGWAQSVSNDFSTDPMSSTYVSNRNTDLDLDLFGSPNQSMRPPPSFSTGLFALPDNTSVNQCLDVYFELFRPWCPVLSRARLKEVFASALQGSDPTATDLAQSIAVLVETRPITTNASPALPTIGPRLRALLERSTKPIRPEDVTINKVMTTLHLFLAWEVLGERLSAWMQFHQVVTLAELLGITDWRNKPVPTAQLFKEEDSLRLFYTLFIIERAHAVLQNGSRHQPLPLLRLPDDAYGATAPFRALLPPDALDDFPLDHLRLFSLVRSNHIACWGDTCGPTCDIWNFDKADRFQQDLGVELELAVAQLESISIMMDMRRTVNLVISIAWFRDRFWNVCLRHKLIQSNAPPCLQHRFILDNLGLLIGVLAEIQPADFGVGLDYGAKLSDMAMTAISILEMARTSAADSPELNLGRDMASLRSDMSSWVYKIIGLLSARPKEHQNLLKTLIQALAPVI